MKEKILIIEDDFTIQTQLKTLLSGNGYEVFAVTDFSQTIEQLKEAAPHLVILDIKLPGNNGFEICSQIRTFSDIPIVFVTSSNTDMDELNSIMLGGDAFITKPYNPAILLAKIAALLKKAYRSPQTEIYVYPCLCFVLMKSTSPIAASLSRIRVILTLRALSST
jgi:two-component system, OmpR family, response regulator protein BraR/BceR